MEKLVILLSIFSALNFNQVYADDSSVNTKFKEQYKQYQAAIESGDKEKIQVTAKNAYILGEQVFGRNNINTFNLHINYANSLADDNPNKLKTLNEIIKLTNNGHPKNLRLLFDVTLPKAKLLNKSNSKEATSLLEDLADKAESVKNYELASLALFEGIKLAAKNAKLARKVKRLILKADKINQAHLPETSIHRLKTDLWVAALYQSRNRKNAAIKRLENVVEIFNNNLDFDHPIELVAHSRLVNLYELKRESDKATKHCIAIAKMSPWQDNIEQTPLYRQAPVYPSNLARKSKSGYVQLQFTISKTGFVKDIEVLNASNKGFVNASIKALKKWRYAPKFVAGEAVEAISTVQLDYVIAKN